MPAEGRRCEVCEAEKVESAAEDDGCETVETRGVPGNLGLVDGKMRGDGTAEALLREYLFGSLRTDLSGTLGGCESGVVSVPCVLGLRVDGVSSW